MSLANVLTVVLLGVLFVAAMWLGEDSRDGADWRYRDEWEERDERYRGGRF